MKLAIPILLAPLFISGSLDAQWDAIDRAPSKPVLSGGDIVAHQNDEGVHAFSPTAGTWKLIAEPSAVLMEVGDWVALVQTSEGWLGYSARLHDTALLVPPTPQAQLVAFRVAGELVAMIFVEPSGPGPAVKTACAYSAQTNAWRSVSMVSPLSVLPGQMLNTGLAIGINDGDRYHGFAARTGEWATHSLTGIPPQGANLMGEGNVLAALVLGLFPNTAQVLAFSGVRGTWSVSPVELDAFNLEVDHNVAVALAFAVPTGGRGLSTPRLQRVHGAMGRLYHGLPLDRGPRGPPHRQRRGAARLHRWCRFRFDPRLRGASWKGVGAPGQLLPQLGSIVRRGLSDRGRRGPVSNVDIRIQRSRRRDLEPRSPDLSVSYVPH
jgi:hypothetical protein